MKAEYPEFTLFWEEGVTSSRMVGECLGEELTHTPSGAPCVPGYSVSLSDTCGYVFLAVTQKNRRIGVDAEDMRRTPPKGFKDIREWTDAEAYCKAIGKNLFSIIREGAPQTEFFRTEIEGMAVSVWVEEEIR